MRTLRATHDLTHGVFCVPGRKVKGLLLAAQVAASQDGQVGSVMPACERSQCGAQALCGRVQALCPSCAWSGSSGRRPAHNLARVFARPAAPIQVE
jgi:hypothetical protein